jgi:integrase/recombinase XerD
VRGLSKESLLLPQSGAPESFRVTMASFLEVQAVRGLSISTQRVRSQELLYFARWCEERGLGTPRQVTRALLERYQRHLFYYRKANGHPLTAATQGSRLVSLRLYFRWLCRENLLELNPASELQLPKASRPLPRYTLSVAEVEKVFAAVDVATLEGVRDRAMLEVLWATGLRRAEVCALSLYDVRAESGTVFVSKGKGKKDRVVPISARALAWVKRYVDEVRPRFVTPPDNGGLFLAESGLGFSRHVLGLSVSRYVKAAGVEAQGACHLFRHACATQMLEAGADIRFVQELLGHSSLTTTQVYTRVAISKLKAVYEATHPGARQVVGEKGSGEKNPGAAELLDALAAEDDDEELTGPPA